MAVLLLAGWIGRHELRGWYILWKHFEHLGKNAQGCTEYSHRPTGVVFVRLRGGTFRMGSPESEPGRGQDESLREVRVSSFLIAKYELTREEWNKVIGHRDPSRPGSTGPNQPVAYVSWDEADDFCKRAGLKLPTEAQWEYACRAGSTGPYAGTGDLCEMGWYVDNSGDSQLDSEAILWAEPDTYLQQVTQNNCRPRAVGGRYPNAWGLHDMHGNVSEYCDGKYHSETTHVVRGGSWGSQPRDCRAAERQGGGTASNIGFRPAVDL